MKTEKQYQSPHIAEEEMTAELLLITSFDTPMHGKDNVEAGSRRLDFDDGDDADEYY